MFETGKRCVVVQEKGSPNVSDTGAIEKICDESSPPFQPPSQDYKSGKVAALNFSQRPGRAGFRLALSVTSRAFERI